MSPAKSDSLRRLVGRDCHKCRAVTIRASAKYGGVFEDRCGLGRDRDKCKRRIYNNAELMTANDQVEFQEGSEAE